MVSYECKCCSFLTPLKSNYIRHLKTIKHINNYKKMTYENKNEPIVYTKYTQSIHNYTQSIHKKYICTECNKNFKSKQSMYRHKRLYCKVKNEENSCIKELKSIVNEQSLHINKLIDKVGTTNITNNNINNIQLNNYGNEDISYITDNLKTILLKGPFNMIPKLIEHVHFNSCKPENKNILLPNKKEDKIKIFSGNKWIYKTKKDVINDLVDGKYFILDTHYENKCKDKFTNMNKNKYEKFRDQFDEKNNKLHEQIKKECELILLNNR